MSEFTEKDRETLNTLVTNVAVITKQLNDLSAIMYGTKADGFLYEFASMRGNIESIPTMAESVRKMSEQVTAIASAVTEIAPKVKKFEAYILRERVRRGLMVSLVSAFVSVVTFFITVKTGIAEYFVAMKGQHP